MVLVADPQIIDPHTYSRRGLALKATIYYTDQFMRRNWYTIQNSLLPSTSLFLGDLFDGGREWHHTPPSLYAQQNHIHTEDPVPVREDPGAEADWKLYKDDYWWKEYVRFLQIFPSYPHRKTIKTLPGNHDLGIGNGIREGVKERFTTYFGETSSVLEAGNHSIVLLDSVSLSNDVNARIYKPEREFLDALPQRLSAGERTTRRLPHTIVSLSEIKPAEPEAPQDPVPWKNKLPTILLTHVPLYRLPETPCGPHRESTNAIAIRGGYQYQNVLTPELSNEILQKTSAKYVFSGDDHDYCEVDHMYTGDQGKVKEITVKSFAWTMGIRRPGFLLVSMWNPTNGGLEAAVGVPTVQSQLCLLPDQIGTFVRYAQMLVVSLLLIVGAVVVRRLRGTAHDEDNSGPLLPTKEKTPSFGISSSSAMAVPRAESRAASGAGYDYYDADDGKYLKPATARNGEGKAKGNGRGCLGGLRDVRDELVAVGLVVLGFYLWLICRW